MKPPQSHKSFLVIAVAITLLVGALYAYMYWQVHVSVRKAITARDLAHNAQIFKEKQNDMMALYESTLNDRARLTTFFIPSDSSVQFIEAVEALGPQSGAKIQLSSIDAAIDPGAGVGTEGGVRAQVDVEGSWTAVYKAILLAERLPYKVVVNNILMSTALPAAGSKAPRVWRAAFDIQASTLVIAQATSTTP